MKDDSNQYLISRQVYMIKFIITIIEQKFFLGAFKLFWFS